MAYVNESWARIRGQSDLFIGHLPNWKTPYTAVQSACMARSPLSPRCLLRYPHLQATGRRSHFSGEWKRAWSVFEISPIAEAVLYKRRSILVFVAVVALVFGWMRWRDYASLRELKELVQIPEVVDVTAVPSHQQMEAIALATQKSPVKPWFATKEDAQELAVQVRENKNPSQMWILVTPLKPEAVGNFYQSEEHRPGWELTANTPGCCLLLRRGSNEMLVAFGLDRAGKGTQVVYSLSLAEQKTAP